MTSAGEAAPERLNQSWKTRSRSARETPTHESTWRSQAPAVPHVGSDARPQGAAKTGRSSSQAKPHRNDPDGLGRPDRDQLLRPQPTKVTWRSHMPAVLHLGRDAPFPRRSPHAKKPNRRRTPMTQRRRIKSLTKQHHEALLAHFLCSLVSLPGPRAWTQGSFRHSGESWMYSGTMRSSST